MIWGESRTVTLRSVVAPGDLAARLKRPHVKALAADMRELGDEPINLLTVKKVRGGWQLVAGRDRFAALSLNGAKKAPVRVIAEATPQELHDLEVSENLHRRVDNRDAMVAERVRKVAARIVAERATSDTNVSKLGRPKSATGEAREVVAAQLGSTPGAVKEAVRREEKREEGRPATAAAPGASAASDPGPGQERPAAPPIELFGNVLPDGVRDMVVPILLGLRKVEAALSSARWAVKELQLTVADPGVSGDLERLIAETLAAVRAARPTHLCPYCKGQVVKCSACKRLGAVTRAVFMSAPPEKRNGWTDDEQAAGLDAVPLVMQRKTVSREELLAGYDGPAVTPGEAMRLARQSGKSAKPVRVVLNGVEMTVEDAIAHCDAQADGGGLG